MKIRREKNVEEIKTNDNQKKKKIKIRKKINTNKNEEKNTIRKKRGEIK